MERLCQGMIRNLICDFFKIAKRTIKNNQDIIAEQCIRTDDEVLQVSNEDEKIVWKSQEKHFNTRFKWVKNFHLVRYVSDVLDLTKTWLESQSVRWKNGKAAGSSGLWSHQEKQELTVIWWSFAYQDIKQTITSTNVGTSSQNFLKISFYPFTTLV